jgi:hypothetical protein
VPSAKALTVAIKRAFLCDLYDMPPRPSPSNTGDSGDLAATVGRGLVLPPEKCPRNSKIVAKDGHDDVDGNDDRDLNRYDHPCFLKSVHGLNLAIKRLKMIPATQSITEPTTVGRSQLCLDIKILKTVALRTHPEESDGEHYFGCKIST